MLEIKCTMHCVNCGAPLEMTARIESEEKSDKNEMSHMRGNRMRDAPFFVWHHNGLNVNGCYVYMFCHGCGADYELNSGIISLRCVLESVDEDKLNISCIDGPTPNGRLTFLKWLKMQRDRSDLIGDLARDAYHNENYHDKNFVSKQDEKRPKDSSRYEAWVSHLQRHPEALQAFSFAWAEYQFLKDY